MIGDTTISTITALASGGAVAAKAPLAVTTLGEEAIDEATCSVCQRSPASRWRSCRSIEGGAGHCASCRRALESPRVFLTASERALLPRARTTIERVHERSATVGGGVVVARRSARLECGCGAAAVCAVAAVCDCGRCEGFELAAVCSACATRLRVDESARVVALRLPRSCGVSVEGAPCRGCPALVVASLVRRRGVIEIVVDVACDRHGSGAAQRPSTHLPL